MKPVINYLKESKAELEKVVWPKPKEVIKLTITVLLVTLLLGIYLGGLDLSFAKILETVISK